VKKPSDTIVTVFPLKSPLIPIFLIVCVDVLGLTIILPLLPFYAEHFGASPAVVGLLVSSYAFCQLIAGPILGRLSDRMGRRPLLLVSQIGTFLGFLLLAASTQLWMVFLSRIIDGATAGNLSLAQAYIADVTKPEERAKSFALIGIAFGMGFLIGPGISGYLSQFGYQYPILVAAGLSFTSILCTYFLLPGTLPHQAEGSDTKRFAILDWGNYVRYFHMPEVSLLLWQFLAFAFTFSAFMSGFALYAERRFTWQGHPFGAKEVGYVFAYVGFLGIILQGGLIGRLVKKFGEAKLIRAGFLTAAIGLTALAFTYTLPALLVFAALAAAGTGVLRPAITSLLTQKTPRSEQGTVLGLTQSINSLSQIVAPFFAGMLIDRHWLTAWALMASITALVGLFL
jgi:DHA1 family tetracycline resistance protein-like MFS transporter